MELRGDEKSLKVVPEMIIPATKDDWGMEYLDYILSVKTVSTIEEAISHINQYNTGHSEAIITENAITIAKTIEITLAITKSPFAFFEFSL